MIIENICIELSGSDTAEVARYQSSRLDRENQLDFPYMGGIMPADDDDETWMPIFKSSNIEWGACSNGGYAANR